MSLKKKIALSFFISSFIIALLATVEYINFIDIRKEIRNLEIADTMRSQSLQLRRHEKNFFLYPEKAADEASEVYRYLKEMEALVLGRIASDRTGSLFQLRVLMNEYRERFNKIESSINVLSDQIRDTGNRSAQYRTVLPLIQVTFREHPLQAAEFLQKVSLRSPDHQLLDRLKALDAEIQTLRKNGEDILGYAKELDKDARNKVERVISISQIAILVVFPLFFISGIGTLFFISRNVVKRLTLLAGSVERTGKGQFCAVAFPPDSRWGDDEVGILIKEFNTMEAQLTQRDEELRIKNEELLQSKKLAAIGTLASGVAHELNNPLNNIYISAQVLEKEAERSCSPTIIETLHDIIGQTIRVKRIVGDLLEFARGRELRSRDVDLSEIIMGAYKMVSSAADTGDIDFTLDAAHEGSTVIQADAEQIERVFINLFTNALDALKGMSPQILRIKIAVEGGKALITVSDTGRGMPAAVVDKIFEPIYSTKDKGTGLGLAIVFNIIKRHAGEIRVESADLKGTTFFITLPLKLKGTTDAEL
ncbi:MAG: ATP-binding protein [Dissulfurispiraceae bacterium]